MDLHEPYVFNPEQQKAIKYVKGPLLIIAGAGTGKTSVIVEKIHYLITKKKVPVQEILALTFTEKAAAEMEERIDKRIPYGYFQLKISTFHALAESVLKNDISHIGISSNFKVMTEAESMIFIRQHLFLFDFKYFRPLGNPYKFIEGLLQHFSRLRDEDISPKEYLHWTKIQNSPLRPLNFEGQEKIKDQNEEALIENEKNIELAKAYETYQTIKIKEGVFDFADLVYYCLLLFRKRKNILTQYQKQYKYILVDEFQDTNICQYELIKLLCPPLSKPNLTVVGDDSQAIYKFRGASVSNILSFMHDYKKAKQISLLKNYRSNQKILDSSYQLIKNNDPDTLEAKLGISKKLISSNNRVKTEPINFHIANSVTEEAEYVANEILRLTKKDYRFDEIAILARANNHVEPFIHTLIRFGIPYQLLGSGILFKQPEIKDLIAYLKILKNSEDSVSLYRVLNMDIFNIDPLDLNKLLVFAKKISQPLFQTMEIYCSLIYSKNIHQDFNIYKSFVPLLKEQTKKDLKKIYDMIVRHFGLIKKETAGQILYYFLEDTGYLLKISSYKTEHDEKISLNISKFFQILKNYEMEHAGDSVHEIVDYLEMSIELGESPQSEKTDISKNNAVNITTVHSSKGLEFSVVFLVNLTQGRFPTRERKEAIPIPDELIKELLPVGDFHLQEERRLFYVGLTRAKDQVFLTTSKFYGEGKREQKISPFAIEVIGEKNINKEKLLWQDSKKQLSIFDYKKKNELFKKVSEKNIPKIISDSVISYSQLESYSRCPLQYKYQYVVRLPTSQSYTLSFGDTIHRTLQEFYRQFQENNKIKLNNLINIYNNYWIPIGYLSSAHEKRMKEEGISILRNYFKKFHSPHLSILDLEKKFIIKINPRISLVGKIDRIDKVKQQIEIVDYKTGKKPTDNELKNSLQLSIYALAATDKNLYHFPLSKITFTYIFLNISEKIQLKKSQEDLFKAKNTIINTVKNIQEKNYIPNPGKWCDFCSFKMVCEAWR